MVTVIRVNTFTTKIAQNNLSAILGCSLYTAGDCNTRPKSQPNMEQAGLACHVSWTIVPSVRGRLEPTHKIPFRPLEYPQQIPLSGNILSPEPLKTRSIGARSSCSNMRNFGLYLVDSCLLVQCAAIMPGNLSSQSLCFTHCPLNHRIEGPM